MHHHRPLPRPGPTVTRLDLSQNELNLSLPTELELGFNLRSPILASNSLGGSFREQLSSLLNITTIHLEGNPGLARKATPAGFMVKL